MVSPLLAFLLSCLLSKFPLPLHCSSNNIYLPKQTNETNREEKRKRKRLREQDDDDVKRPDQDVRGRADADERLAGGLLELGHDDVRRRQVVPDADQRRRVRTALGRAADCAGGRRCRCAFVRGVRLGRGGGR